MRATAANTTRCTQLCVLSYASACLACSATIKATCTDTTSPLHRTTMTTTTGATHNSSSVTEQWSH
jgi:hypothetical protein